VQSSKPANKDIMQKTFHPNGTKGINLRGTTQITGKNYLSLVRGITVPAVLPTPKRSFSLKLPEDFQRELPAKLPPDLCSL